MSLNKLVANMKRNITSLLFVFIASAFTQNAVASVVTGHVRAIYSDLNVGSGNVVFLQMAVSPANAACADNPNVDYAFDASTQAGKILYATILAAYVSQEEVVIGGTDLCTLSAAFGVNAENLRWVRAQ